METHRFLLAGSRTSRKKACSLCFTGTVGNFALAPFARRHAVIPPASARPCVPIRIASKISGWQTVVVRPPRVSVAVSCAECGSRGLSSRYRGVRKPKPKMRNAGIPRPRDSVTKRSLPLVSTATIPVGSLALPILKDEQSPPRFRRTQRPIVAIDLYFADRARRSFHRSPPWDPFARESAP
jgi:hypothetical protein